MNLDKGPRTWRNGELGSGEDAQWRGWMVIKDLFLGYSPRGWVR